jgi:hypothetical protein
LIHTDAALLLRRPLTEEETKVGHGADKPGRMQLTAYIPQALFAKLAKYIGPNLVSIAED